MKLNFDKVNKKVAKKIKTIKPHLKKKKKTKKKAPQNVSMIIEESYGEGQWEKLPWDSSS